jgi:hypothetical protein
MRRIYQAVVIPQMLFGVSAWYQPMVIGKMKARTISQPFVTIQKRAACLISGAFRTTAPEALNTELHLPPIAIHMNRLKRQLYDYEQDQHLLFPQQCYDADRWA